MRHFYRSHSTPEKVVALMDPFFAALGMMPGAATTRTRVFSGLLGTVRLSAKPEGGHYTFVEAVTDQIGESRLDKNVKRFFSDVHRAEDPTHQIQASY